MGKKEILLYAAEIVDTIEEMTEKERQRLLEYAKKVDYDGIKLFVIELKTKYGYYGGNGGKF